MVNENSPPDGPEPSQEEHNDSQQLGKPNEESNLVEIISHAGIDHGSQSGEDDVKDKQDYLHGVINLNDIQFGYLVILLHLLFNYKDI